MAESTRSLSLEDHSIHEPGDQLWSTSVSMKPTRPAAVWYALIPHPDAPIVRRPTCPPC
jgi:hypothetical protein